MSQYTEFEPKNMIFKRLGPSGLRVPIFSLGGWLTLGGTVKGDPVKDILKAAFEAGINMFDTAEGYAAGQSEIEMGRVIKELKWRRTDLIITTKIFFGTRSGPNDKGLSRKHIVEGLNESLERLQLDYVDVEEIVRAFNHVIDQGKAFYWATSEWSAREIEEAHGIAARLGLIAPIAEQCQHNRQRPEVEYSELYQKYNYGTTVFSALASGLLTGKYNNGIPSGSRFENHADFFKKTIDSLNVEEGQKKIAKVKALTEYAEKELGCSVTHLSLAWVAKQPQTGTVILGASRPEQVLDNLKALEVLPKLTPEVMKKIAEIVDTDPTPESTWGR
ncbi:Aldo/keto reductase [Sistotremastrum niveocremeum HHB9708]|uniref:Aldo/keto reductase n=1 Tax=Sistotremastrum niveocremeum HHB9708 TaxID=1314777 RepID=A0A165A458_9AGAM|nr:Aldo/keto reductase [Sistotremastrum niveocremeum HHB9708]